MKKIFYVLLMVGFSSIYSLPAIAELDGEKLYITKTCFTCHGPDGISIIPNYPNIAGQKKLYLIDSISGIRSGNRTGGQTALMKAIPFVQSLTPAEIEALADYISDLD